MRFTNYTLSWVGLSGRIIKYCFVQAGDILIFIDSNVCGAQGDIKKNTSEDGRGIKLKL